MAKSGPIIIVEDDPDDHAILEEILKEIKVENELLWFTNGPAVITYLNITADQPFLILCDVNLPGQNGIEFKKQIDADPVLRQKSIPFIFFSTSVDQWSVNEAYTKMTVQGFFKKENSYTEIKKAVALIIDYWNLCKHPNV